VPLIDIGPAAWERYGHLVHRLHLCGCLSQSAHPLTRSSQDWLPWGFDGLILCFKLHLVVNDRGESKFVSPWQC
jgi:hypothetical protein